MGKCPAQRFPKFTSECIEALRGKLQTVGVDPKEAAAGKTSGHASRAGFEIQWTYDLEKQALTIQCVASPFYAPCKVITTQIESWVRECYPPCVQQSGAGGQGSQSETQGI